MASNTQNDNKWKEELANAAQRRESALNAETFLREWPSYSHPIALGCDDGNEYVVKGQHAGRAIFNDQVVARLGLLISAPVGFPVIVNIPPTLVAAQPEMANVRPGTAHGTLYIKNCSDRQWLLHSDVVQNRQRFARISVLYGWCYASDHQLIFENDPPNLVHSVDHGHFFPNGPDWTMESLAATTQLAELEQRVVSEFNLNEAERKEALKELSKVKESSIVAAVAAPPDEWGVSEAERIALVEFLVRRLRELLTHA